MKFFKEKDAKIIAHKKTDNFFSNDNGKYKQFVAEGWSEYLNSISPRPIAKFIGEFILEAYEKRGK
ncbi:MAG: hypothetical protein CSA15_01375 [Candidatus Delongbacteria bacterium]|nr:MAG: hypothetical protein CSA15_01375 [Candidatus Delongbacteria bacterium]